jgi:hypothetical protein
MESRAPRAEGTDAGEVFPPSARPILEVFNEVSLEEPRDTVEGVGRETLTGFPIEFEQDDREQPFDFYKPVSGDGGLRPTILAHL